MEVETEKDNGIVENENISAINEYIRNEFQAPIPALIFEYIKEKSISYHWDHDDLMETCSKLGKISQIESLNEKAVLLFESFIDAYSCKNYFDKESNYNGNSVQKVKVRWYKQEDEHFVNKILKEKIKKVSFGNSVENINTSMLLANEPRGNQILDDYEEPSLYFLSLKAIKNENIATNSYAQYTYYSQYSLPPEAKLEFKNLMIQNHKKGINSYNIQNQNSEASKYSNENAGERSLLNGKFYCKFFIQIDNDPEFDIARRIIGAKGCNIKRIIDYCSKGPNGARLPDSLKIRLRGKGSGYKEGPYRREREEPLQLCVSSKYLDKYRKACIFVQELLINIYEEYKRFCERTGKTPNKNLTIQKLENIN